MSKPRTIKINGQPVKSVKINGKLWFSSGPTKINTPHLPHTTFSYCDSYIDVRAYLADYNDTTVRITGEYEQIASGTYAIYIEPLEGYCWRDGSTDRIVLTWEILPRQASYITVRYQMQTNDYGDWDEGSLVTVSGSYWIDAYDEYGHLSTSDYLPINNVYGDYSYENEYIDISGHYEDIYYSFEIEIPVIDDNYPDTVYSEDNGNLIFYR